MSIEIIGYKKTYQKTVFENLSMTLQPQRVYGLMGQNGAGKSTLMKCFLGLCRSNGGSALVDGIVPRVLMRKNQIGYMPEIISNMGRMTGREYIFHLMMLRGIKWSEVEERFEQLQERLFVKKFMDIPMEECSKGSLKKILFIQAILHKPKVLILDEPTDGLDPISRKNMLKEVRSTAAEGGYVIFSTHLLSDVQDSCDEVLVLQRGKVIANMEVARIIGPIEDWYIKLIEESGEINDL